MSKEEHSVQSKKIYISSNDSLNKKRRSNKNKSIHEHRILRIFLTKDNH